MLKNCLLSVEQMIKADNIGVVSGIPVNQLMEAAGRGVFSVITRRWPPCQVLVLCWPGNNGCDSFYELRDLGSNHEAYKSNGKVTMSSRLSFLL